MDDFVLFLDSIKSQGGPLGDLEAFVSASPDLTTVQKANLFSAIRVRQATGKKVDDL